MNGNKLFPNFMAAVNALKECCGKNVETPPIARSEVYNETWMLRLTLALIHDSDLKENAPNALRLVKSAIMHNWISEGGLEPAFEREGTTWTDAILGDVKIGDNSKRGIVLAPISDGVVIVEAKIGSELASGITNSSNYNQAARNIACLAKRIEGKGNAYYKKCAFLVFAPEVELKEWEKSSVPKPIETAREVIADQEKESPQHPKRTHKWNDNTGFWGAVDSIIENSVALSWENVINSIQCETNINYLRDFYAATCKLYGIETPLQHAHSANS